VLLTLKQLGLTCDLYFSLSFSACEVLPSSAVDGAIQVRAAKAKIHYTSFPVASPSQAGAGKSRCSVVSCRYLNSITTCCQEVGNFPVYGEVTGKRV